MKVTGKKGEWQTRGGWDLRIREARLCDQRADLLHTAGGERNIARRVIAVCDHGSEDAAKLRGSGGIREDLIAKIAPHCASGVKPIF